MITRSDFCESGIVSSVGCAATATSSISCVSNLYFTTSGLSEGSTWVPVGNPVAMMVHVMRLPVSSLEPIPIITFALPPASR